jgi:hypothetical protein
VTSQGTAHGRFTRAIQQRNLWAAETSLRELGSVSLEDALGYLDLLAEQKPEKLERAAVRWHGRLETEATFLSLAESQLALAALASLCAGERDAIEVLRRLLRRVRPTVVPCALYGAPGRPTPLRLTGCAFPPVRGRLTIDLIA